MSKSLFVRIRPKQGTSRFYRCAMEFGLAWTAVAVDAATAARLQAEQMLEVSETQPGDFDAPLPHAADPAGQAPQVAPVADAPAAAPAGAPLDPAARAAAIQAAIGQLDKTHAEAWKKDGSPKTEAIEFMVGWALTAAERDAAWAEFNRVSA